MAIDAYYYLTKTMGPTAAPQWQCDFTLNFMAARRMLVLNSEPHAQIRPLLTEDRDITSICRFLI